MVMQNAECVMQNDKPCTKVNLLGIELDNPIIPASGTFGFGYEFAEIYDINILGTFSLRELPRSQDSATPLPELRSVRLV